MRSAPPLADCVKLAAVVDHGLPLRGGRFGSSGSALGGGAALRIGGIGLQRQAPFGGERVLVDLVLAEAHWTTISLNSTALMRLGEIAALTRRVSSSLRR